MRDKREAFIISSNDGDYNELKLWEFGACRRGELLELEGSCENSKKSEDFFYIHLCPFILGQTKSVKNS